MRSDGEFPPQEKEMVLYVSGAEKIRSGAVRSYRARLPPTRTSIETEVDEGRKTMIVLQIAQVWRSHTPHEHPPSNSTPETTDAVKN